MRRGSLAALFSVLDTVFALADTELDDVFFLVEAMEFAAERFLSSCLKIVLIKGTLLETRLDFAVKSERAFSSITLQEFSHVVP